LTWNAHCRLFKDVVNHMAGSVFLCEDACQLLLMASTNARVDLPVVR
jgi:hypothetical protein